MEKWNTRIVSSEKPGDTSSVQIAINKALGDGYEIKGYSVDNKFHSVLLVKKEKPKT